MQPKANWLARAVLAGFCAIVTSICAVIVGYVFAMGLSNVHLANANGALGNTATVETWFHNLIQNDVVNLTVNSMVGSIALHCVVAMFWAVVYAWWAEPRLRGSSLEKGIVFALLPWMLSLVVFLPLVGGGMFGVSLGAGPLPALGNLIVHLVYGATLGVVYGPFADRLVEKMPEAQASAEAEALHQTERGAAKGILVGLLVGFALGLVGFFVGAAGHLSEIVGLAPAWFILSCGLMGGALGVLVGSMLGLPTAPHQTNGPH